MAGGGGGAIVVQRKWKIYNSKGGSESGLEFLAREVTRILRVLFCDSGSELIENKNTKYKKIVVNLYIKRWLMIKVDKFDKLKEVNKYLSLHETEY